MANQTYSGTETPVFIKKNTSCVTYGVTFDPVDQGVPGSGSHIVIENGVIMVSSAYSTPYTSFATLIAYYPALVGLVVNMDTGEFRYYNHPILPLPAYIDPLHDSVGFIKSWTSNISRPVTVMHEVGEAEPVDGKQTTVTYKIKLEKIFNSRWKTAYTNEVPAAVVNQKIHNPIGMAFIEGIIDTHNGTDQGRDGYTDTFLVAMYARDNSEAAQQRGNIIIFPCCKIGDAGELKSSTEGVYLESIDITPIHRMIHAPRDIVQSYTLAAVHPQ